MSGGGRFVWTFLCVHSSTKKGNKQGRVRGMEMGERNRGGFISHSCNNELSPMTAVILTRSEIS